MRAAEPALAESQVCVPRSLLSLAPALLRVSFTDVVSAVSESTALVQDWPGVGVGVGAHPGQGPQKV